MLGHGQILVVPIIKMIINSVSYYRECDLIGHAVTVILTLLLCVGNIIIVTRLTLLHSKHTNSQQKSTRS